MYAQSFQTNHVLVVDYTGLAPVFHHPILSYLSRSLRTVARLAAMAGQPCLLPGLAILVARPHSLEQLLPLTPVNPGTSKTVAAALARLDSVLASLPSTRQEDELDCLVAAASHLATLAGPLQPHVLTCRSRGEVRSALLPCSEGVREPLIMRPGDGGEQEVQVTVLSDELDLDCYFRSWLMPQPCDSSGLRLEVVGPVGKEVVLLDLCLRSVVLGPGARRPREGEDRLVSAGLVAQEGVCQSLVLGDGTMAVATRALLLGARELRENREKVAALHKELVRSSCCLLARSQEHIYCLAPCSGASLLVQRLATAETLLPLPPGEGATEMAAGRRLVSLLRGLEKKDVYNPLEHDLGLLEVKEQQGSRGRGRAPGRGGRGRGGSWGPQSF